MKIKTKTDNIERFIERQLEVKPYPEFKCNNDLDSAQKFIRAIEPLKLYERLLDNGISKEDALHAAFIYRTQMYSQIIKYLNYQGMLSKVK